MDKNKIERYYTLAAKLKIGKQTIINRITPILSIIMPFYHIQMM